jgi:hypothetical protein
MNTQLVGWHFERWVCATIGVRGAEFQSVGYTQFNGCAFCRVDDFELLLPGEIPSAQNSLQTNLSPTRHASIPLGPNGSGSPQYTHIYSARSRGRD